MGKKHASQYANFGSLQKEVKDYNYSPRSNMYK